MSDFSNVRQVSWHSRGFLASQTAYVTLALALLVAAISVVAPEFLSFGNLSNVLTDFSYIGIVAFGSTLVIITGGIDLSVGSSMGLSAIIAAMLFRALGPTAVAAVPGAVLAISVVGGLAVGATIGLINGLLIAYTGLAPFVTTLGMLSIVRGLCYAITNGQGVDITGPEANLFFRLSDGTLLGLPVPLLYLLALGVMMGLLLHHTARGRYVFAIGGNERAAALTGVPVQRVKTGVYVLSGLTAALSGILLGGWLGSVPANLADGYELRIIAASVIGGANLLGGVGGPLGAIVGSALIEVIRNGLVLARVNTYWQQTVVGAIIIAAVLVDRLRSRRLGQ
ncbi:MULTISPECIES: ABC transporter permease [Acidiphilium]|uniref:Monosaccharide ABC transporter membrane protein, CUT2 family n=1 Tax=Acidiphilium rubrum TaxID=526 RepID=A0A8G2CL11_ACIRU|nr:MULTISPECIES: ABC transporter permease [Acidiphilium]MBW4034820.1 ABC transporter permease [Pseudomonadota bacterium]SIQ90459.1 monosaccharide ABC transporter membrane protein, CUT2 family [Acidiphilium rubrum]